MLKSSLITITLLIALSVQGQSDWGWDVAGSAAYAKNLDAIGPQVRAYVLVDDQFCYGLEYSIYKFDHNQETGWFNEINLNAHYVFHVGHKFGVYPLAGLNWSLEKLEDHSKDAFGINTGAGFHVFAGRWVPYLEYAYTTGPLKDQKFLLGTYFIIKDIAGKSKHE